MVERILGKAEVVSSILTGSTIFSQKIIYLAYPFGGYSGSLAVRVIARVILAQNAYRIPPVRIS